MGLGHSAATRGQPMPDPAVEPASEDRQAVIDETWPTLADGVVPMRDAAQRELDRDREERVRLVVEKRHGLPRPPARRLTLAVAGLAAVLAGIVSIALADQGGASASSEPPVAAVQHQLPAPTSSSRPTADATRLRQARAMARAQRRAAIRAHREAARRRAKQRSTRRQAAHRAQKKQHAAPRSEPATRSEANLEPAPAPEPPITSTTPPPAPPPAPATTTSPSPSPAQSEFGFER